MYNDALMLIRLKLLKLEEGWCKGRVIARRLDRNVAVAASPRERGGGPKELVPAATADIGFPMSGVSPDWKSNAPSAAAPCIGGINKI